MNLSPLLNRSGAVAATGPDHGVAAHYGQPVAEQRALERGIGVVDLSHMGVLTVSGVDRLSWLNTLSTQVIAELAPGESTELLLLDPNGRIEQQAAVVDDGQRTWLVTESAHAEGLANFLNSMRFMLRVEVTREDTAVLATNADGPNLAGLVPSECSPAITWTDPWPRTAPGATHYAVADVEHPGSQWRGRYTLVDRAAVRTVVEAAEATGARLTGAWAWEAMRVSTWRPRLAREVDERTIPHELDWLRTAVHLNKGCYRGQESVARVFNMGRPPRRLVLLHLDGSDHLLPDNGAEVMAGERAVGRLTSVVRHHELGPIALAVLKRSVDPTAELTVAGIAAAQEVIVSPDGTGTGRPEISKPALRRRTLT